MNTARVLFNTVVFAQLNQINIWHRKNYNQAFWNIQYQMNNKALGTLRPVQVTIIHIVHSDVKIII